MMIKSFFVHVNLILPLLTVSGELRGRLLQKGGGDKGNKNGGGNNGNGNKNGGGNGKPSFGNGSTCINQPEEVPFVNELAPACESSISVNGTTYEIECIGMDEDNGTEYIGTYACHEPNPGKVFPMLKCIPNNVNMTAPAGTRCGWCCLAADNDPGEPQITRECAANPCLTDEDEEGYLICTNFGGKPWMSKMRTKCIAADDATDALYKWGSYCGACA